MCPRPRAGHWSRSSPSSAAGGGPSDARAGPPPLRAKPLGGRACWGPKPAPHVQEVVSTRHQPGHRRTGQRPQGTAHTPALGRQHPVQPRPWLRWPQCHPLIGQTHRRRGQPRGPGAKALLGDLGPSAHSGVEGHAEDTQGCWRWSGSAQGRQPSSCSDHLAAIEPLGFGDQDRNLGL